MSYWDAIASPALQAGAPRPRLTRPERWAVPIELALATTSSVFAGVIRDRYAGGGPPPASAEVFLAHGRFFATCHYGQGAWMLLPLDAWVLESGR